MENAIDARKQAEQLLDSGWAEKIQNAKDDEELSAYQIELKHEMDRIRKESLKKNNS